MILVIVSGDKTINSWVCMKMENHDTSVHFPLLIHGENCCLFSEVWLCWGVCLCVCVLLRVSDAANCPFAVYPMGSGISLVTACSFSLNRPVAIAALQRTAPPPSAWRVTGQLEQGTVTGICCDYSSEERGARQGTPYTDRVPTRPVSEQARWAKAL